MLEIYADGPLGANFVNGNFHFVFTTIRTDHTSDPATQYRQVTSRLILPLAGVLDLQAHIMQMMTTLQQQGIVQPIMPGPQTRQ